MRIAILTDPEDYRLTLANLGENWTEYAGGAKYMVKLTLLSQGAYIVPPA